MENFNKDEKKGKILINGITFALVECSACGLTKNRRVMKTYGKVKHYTDENHKAWKGKKCPSCVKELHKNLMRKLRNSQLGKFNCLNCGKEFDKMRGHQTYCSKSCRSLIRSKKS